MPTYQYRCTECGRELEVVQKFSDPSLTQCPNCSGQLRKIFNAVGVVFKGSGFYRTDSRDAGKKRSGGDATKPKTPAESSGSSSDGSSAGKDNGAGKDSSSGSSSTSGEKKPATSGAGTAAASA